jgi:hypothetical protein
MQCLAGEIEDLLAGEGGLGFKDLRHYDLHRPVDKRYSHICCTYLQYKHSVVLLERIVLPSKRKIIEQDLHTGRIDHVFLYFIDNADYIIDSLDIFRPKLFRRGTRDSFLEKEVWRDMRCYPYSACTNYPNVVCSEDPAQFSGQMLLRAVNHARWGNVTET